MLRRPAPLLAVLALLLAGCLTASLPPPGAGADVRGLAPVGEPIVQDHDHSDPALHQGSANIAFLGHHSGYGDGATAEIPEGQGFAELAVWTGERDGATMTLVFLGRRNGPDGGFVILDATDPTAIQRRGAWAGLGNYDVEVSHDGRYAFFTTQWLPTQSGGAQDPVEDQRGVYVVDLADLDNPTLATFFYPPTRGAHTVTYHRTEAGQELLMVNSYDFVPDPSLGLPVPGLGSNPVAHRIFVTEFVRDPAPALNVLSVYQKTDQLPPPGEAYFPHDTFLQEHPVTGQLILYVSYWDLGAFLVDLTDPANPRDISQLTDFSPSQHKAIHFTRPAPELIDGVHLTVTEPELGPTDETGQLTFYDTTDPANPIRLGYWELPGDVVITEGLIFSPHNFDIERGRIYLAHYHAGVWVVDVSTRALLDQPASLGFWQVAVPREGHGGYQPDFWSAFLEGDRIYASDQSAGLQVLQFALDAPGPSAPAPAAGGA